MWREFVIHYDGVAYQCSAKVFDNPSIFGIRRGRVSKLDVTATNPYDGTEMAGWCYDRGWPVMLDEDGKEVDCKAPEWFIDLLMQRFPETLTEKGK